MHAILSSLAAMLRKEGEALLFVKNWMHDTDSLNGKLELGLRVQPLRWATAWRTRVLRGRELHLL